LHSFTVGYDDRVYGVEGIQAINVRTVYKDILEPKDLDRKLIVYLMANPKKVNECKVGYQDVVAKYLYSEIFKMLKEKKYSKEELQKIALEKFAKNTKVINDLFARTPMNDKELESTIERINYRNFVSSTIGEFEKTDKGLMLKIFRILIDEIEAEGYQSLTIDDGKEFVDMCANYKLEEYGINEFGDLAMGKFYPIYRDFAQEEMKNVLSRFSMVVVNCHEDYVEITDEHTDTKHMMFYPDFGDKKCLNGEMANWFTLVGRAILDPNDEDHPYKIDFSPKKYSLSKCPHKFGIKDPIPNDYNSLMEYVNKK
jgi:hypothetical protein